MYKLHTSRPLQSTNSIAKSIKKFYENQYVVVQMRKISRLFDLRDDHLDSVDIKIKLICY